MDTIGRYHILGELGRGAMGIVYRALDPAIGRTVAIKTIRLSEFVDPAERSKLRDRLFREAQSAGILSHPGIVTIFDIAEEDDVAYIAMEFVDGPTLDKLIASEPPDGQRVLSILAQTAAALDYAHKRGIVHRDIKPANVMIHERTTAKIADFGVAKIQSHQMTQAGAMVGTPNYMSPEQIQGKAVDGRSDQYSLAVIAYELLTGEKPFTGDSIAQLALRIVQEQPASVHRCNPSLDWPVDTVLQRALAKDPAQRYATCADFAHALANACKACKTWKPLPPGAAQQAATLVAPAAVAAADAGKGEARAAEPAPVPASLRVLRRVAAVVFGVGVLVLLAVTGLRFLNPEGPQDTARVEQPQGAAQTAKPSPMPEVEAPVQEEKAPETAAEEPAEPPSAPAPPKPEQTRPGIAQVVTNPPGAVVTVDGRSDLNCTSPCSLELPPGRHTLAATLQGHRRTLKIFEVPRDSVVALTLDRNTGTLMVRSDPRGASIFIDGKEQHDRTPAMLTLPTGRYTLEVVRDGERERQEVVVRESAITNVAVNFER